LLRVFIDFGALVETALARLSHLEGIRAHKSNGMSKGYTKVFTTKAELITLRSGE
jgi:hypothetical protein